MLLAKLFPDEQYDKKPRHDTDSRATLRAGVRRIYPVLWRKHTT
jgi:hypothetical protein